MGKIRVSDIRIRANHGCMQEEAAIGGDYIIHVELETNMRAAFESDALEDTVDYVQVHDIVFRETRIRSKLIEHVAARIADALKKEIHAIANVTVQVIKLSPPIGGDVGSVSVEVSR